MTSSVAHAAADATLVTAATVANLPVVPVALPLIAGAVLVLLRNRPVLSRVVSMGANLAGLAASAMLVERVRTDGIQVLAFGGWQPPYGIVFAVDMLSALMVFVTMIVSTATLIFACWSIDERRERMCFHALFQLLLMGVNGSFLTGDLFNLFVWFEVLLITSYALMSLGSERYQLQETFKYLVMNAVASALFLIGLAALYGATGTLNMADLSTKYRAIADPALRGGIAAVFLVVFGLKGGLFPLYMWLPRAYFAPPTVIAGLFGGLLTKVGVYALIRVVSLMFAGTVGYVLPLLVFISGCTMLFGVLGALAQWDFKRILSYHIVSQIGYMIMGLGLYSPLALAGAIFYIVHHILVKTALFLIAGSVEKLRGTTHLPSLGSIVDDAPATTALFFIAGLSLAGAPPFSGFIAKFMLIRAGLEQGAYGIVFVSVVVSFLTLFSMMKIFRYAFWSEEKVEHTTPIVPGGSARFAAAAILVGLGIALGLGGAVFLPYTVTAAEQLLDPAGYAATVLAGR